MTLLDKLNVQTVSRQIQRDPAAERPARFRAGIAEQRLVLAALERAAEAGELDGVLAAAAQRGAARTAQ
jgi:hypothetical protein